MTNDRPIGAVFLTSFWTRSHGRAAAVVVVIVGRGVADSTAQANANSSKYLYSFTYGYVESRFKFPATRGFFTAFWMVPTDPTYNHRSEIDILDLLVDDPTTMFMTYHYNNRSESYTPNRASTTRERAR